MNTTLQEKFSSHVCVVGDHWLWNGGKKRGKDGGYIIPWMHVGCGKYRAARHVSLELHGGAPIAPGEEVVSSCAVSTCVRPEHAARRCKKRVGTQAIPDSKKCRACLVVKPFSEFPRKQQKVDGLESYCTECRREKQRNANLLHFYGITATDYDTMYNNQDGKCAACGDAKDMLHVDHCHSTGRVRALLCSGCNVSLGHVKDSVTRLHALVRYVEEFC